MVITSDYNGAADCTVRNRIVECLCDHGSARSISIEYPCLRSYHQPVSPGLFYPVYVVSHLLMYLCRRLFHQCGEDAGSDLIRFLKVAGITRAAYPAERAEPVIKTKRSHNI